MPSKHYGGFLPSTRARSKALYQAYGRLREALASERYTPAVSELNEAHKRAKAALAKEYSLRKYGLRVRPREGLPVTLKSGTDNDTRLIGHLAGVGTPTGLLSTFKREVEAHLFVAAPAHAAMSQVQSVVSNAPKMVLDPDETSRNLKPIDKRRYGPNVQAAAEKFLRTGDIEELENMLYRLSGDRFLSTANMGDQITKNSIMRFVVNLKAAMQHAHSEIKELERLPEPSSASVEFGKLLGIDVKNIHRVASENLRWKNMLPHRIGMLAELERRYKSRSAQGSN